MDISVAAFLKEQERNREKNGAEETELEKLEREHTENHTKFRSLQVRFIKKKYLKLKENFLSPLRQVSTVLYYLFRVENSRQVFPQSVYVILHVRIHKALLI